MQPTQSNMHESSNNLLALLGTMPDYVNTINTLFSPRTDDLFGFTVHAIIGGTIMLAVKVLSYWIHDKIKHPRQRTKKSHE